MKDCCVLTLAGKIKEQAGGFPVWTKVACSCGIESAKIGEEWIEVNFKECREEIEEFDHPSPS